MKMAKKEMTKKEILGFIEESTKKAWERHARDAKEFGISSERAQRSLTRWSILDDICCELDILY